MAESSERSERCAIYCRKTFLFLSYAVATVGSIAYCFYLIWLLAYLKDSGYYWFFAAIPGFFVILTIAAAVLKKKDPLKDIPWKYCAMPCLFSVLLMLMCSFRMLTRKAYYHLSPDAFIGPRWVIMSLQGSIVFFVCGFLIEKKCGLQKILKHKDILTRGLLDFVDIFNLVELLSLNQCVGIGSYVTEESSLEKAIQSFCTTSFLIVVFCIYEKGFDEDSEDSEDNEDMSKKVFLIYMASLIFQNIPFLIIRIFVWAKYNVFSLGFMVKNILAIVVCCAEIKPFFEIII